MNKVMVIGGFDNLRENQVRFLHEAARFGKVHVLLWSDEALEQLEGQPPTFPVSERKYLVEANRYVDLVTVCGRPAEGALLPAEIPAGPAILVDHPGSDNAARETACRDRGLEYRVLSPDDLLGLPDHQTEPSPDKQRVVVTGCYDWFHSGHVRFFEEVSELGELYVIVGHDANIKLLKGEGHPMFPAEVRRYIVGSVRHVTQAWVSSGDGWMDAEPEFAKIRPHIYAVNEDGARPEKKAFCEANGLEYRVLKRLPKDGLPARQSTDLRGF